jgi:Domain of unknown function (DUF3806)
MGFFKRAAPVQEVEPERPRFSALGDAERDWMAGHLEVIDEFGVDLDSASDVARLYDYFLTLPTEDDDGNRIDPSVFINILGTVFGAHLTRRTTLAWAIATDSHGSELVVHDPRGDWLVYPANTIAKRWTTGQSGDFIPVMSADIVARMNAR